MNNRFKVIVSYIMILGLISSSSLSLSYASEDAVIKTAKTDTKYSLMVSDMVAESKESFDNGASTRLLIVGNPKLDFSYVEGIEEMVSSGDNLYVIQFDTVESAVKAYKRIKRWRGIDSIEYDQTIKMDALRNSIRTRNFDITSAIGSEPYMSWGASVIGVDKYSTSLHRFNLKTAVVAVVDSGIDLQHQLFTGKVMQGYDFVDNDSVPEDTNGHGTHVSGIITDNTRGVDKIKIMPLKVLDKKGEGETSTLTSAILYAADHGVPIINLSLGSFHSAYVDAVIKRVSSKGMIVFTASGNEGRKIDHYLDCPAHMDSTITVGAINKYLRADQYSNYGKALDVVAPGTNIKSAFPINDYETMSGTSMAVPHVSACAALITCRYGNMDVGKMKSVLYRSCNKKYDTSRYGKGIINLANLIKNISQHKVALKTTYTYRPGGIRPKISISRNGEELFKGLDYSVSYSNNTAVGKGDLIVTGKGTYSGKIKKSFNIIPQGTSITTIKGKRKAFVVKWKMKTLKMPAKRINGYQIRYSNKSSMTSAKTASIKGYKKASKIVKRMKSKKKYYIQIRTYMKAGGKTYYSSWSSKKVVKIK